MKSLLTYDGWESMELRPHGWLFKRIWEGQEEEGFLLERAKAAIE